MKKLLLVTVAVALLAPSVSAQVSVRGYVRKDGTYVAPHYRSAPNSNPYDNYSTKGNINPYTGQAGTQNPYSTYTPRTYSSPSYPSYPTYRAPSYSPYSGYGSGSSTGSYSDRLRSAIEDDSGD